LVLFIIGCEFIQLSTPTRQQKQLMRPLDFWEFFLLFPPTFPHFFLETKYNND